MPSILLDMNLNKTAPHFAGHRVPVSIFSNSDMRYASYLTDGIIFKKGIQYPYMSVFMCHAAA